MLRRALGLLPFSSFATQTQSKHNVKPDPVPLSVPFPTDTNLSNDSITSTTGAHPEGVQVTRLQNGARIISHDVGGAVSSIGAYILAGPAFESINYPGLGAMLQSVLTMHSSKPTDPHGKKVSSAEGLYPRVHKYHVSVHVNCPRDKWHAYDLSHSTAEERARMKSKWSWSSHETKPVRDTITENLTEPPLQETVIKSLCDSCDARLKELRWQRPTEYAKLALETIAFYLEPLGSPRYAPVESASYITSAILQEHHNRYASPSRTIIAGVNVDHDALVAVYENALSRDPKPPAEQQNVPAGEDREVDLKTEARQYTGGEFHDHEDRAKAIITKPFMDTETICAVGWLVYGRDRVQLRRHAACLVTKALLEVGLTNELLNNSSDARAQNKVHAFYTAFQTAGLLGLTLISEPEQAPKMLLDALRLVKAMKNAQQEALNVAKLSARVSFLNENTVNVQDYCDFLCTSLPPMSDSTMVTNLDEILHAIEAVSTTDIKDVIDMMLSHPTSFFGHGEILSFPSIRRLGL